MELNKIYCENNLDTLARMPGNFLDLTVTSPPYDNLRTYNGYSFDFETMAKELYRATKLGGVVVWVVGDATVDGCETGTSFKQALYFMQCGFNLHDTMIWRKPQTSSPSPVRYHQSFEYMFVLSKGRPSKVNLIKDRANIYAGKVRDGNFRSADGNISKRSVKTVSDFGIRFNVWDIPANTHAFRQHNHPATFPEKLVKGHIITWSNCGDLIYDPFMGSGTTGKVAKECNRLFIGSEISQEYCKISEQRIFGIKIENEAAT